MRAAAAGGARSSLAITEATGAGGVCGSCGPLLAELAGEAAGARRIGAGWRIAASAVVALALLVAGALLGPIPMSTSIEAGPSIDFLWRDAWWKQVSGYTLLALCAASLPLLASQALEALHARRLSELAIPAHRAWRRHDRRGWCPYRLPDGANLNYALMACFVGVVALGSLAALVTSLEHRLPAPYGGLLRRSWTWAHILVFWPMPLLVAFHVLTVYFY